LTEQIRAIAEAVKFADYEAHSGFVGSVQSWCEGMLVHTLFRCPEGWALLRVLCEWILSTAVPDPRRMRSVAFLLSRLDDATEDWAEQLNRLRSWAGYCFRNQAEFRPLVRKKLQQLETAATSAKSTS
jgi:hypothetical protein